MALKEFLENPDFTHDRELMLMHKLIYDCRLVLARLEDRLQVFQGEVDHDGFDVMFDDRDQSKRFQVKTVFGGTTSWNIHRSLLRPTAEWADYYGYDASPTGIGIGGGVILQEIDVRPADELLVHYSYTDLNIIRAFNLEIIKRPHAYSQKTVVGLFQELRRGRGKETIPIARGAFVDAKGPAELLALAEFNTGVGGLWPWWLKNVSALDGGFVKPEEAIRNLPTDEAGARVLIHDQIAALCKDQL